MDLVFLDFSELQISYFFLNEKKKDDFLGKKLLFGLHAEANQRRNFYTAVFLLGPVLGGGGADHELSIIKKIVFKRLVD